MPTVKIHWIGLKHHKGFQSIVWTFVRHTLSRCLTFPALPEVARPSGQVAFTQFLPSGQYGLCFGYCFSGPLPLCSHHGQVTLRGACLRESLVVRLYSEIGQIHLSIEAQCGTPVYLWVTATLLTYTS